MTSDEEKRLWAKFEAQFGSFLDPVPDATKQGPTADWLRTNLDKAVGDGSYPEPAVLACAELAGRCAVQLQAIFAPGSRVVDENLFAAAVYAVQKYQNPYALTKLSVICVP